MPYNVNLTVQRSHSIIMEYQENLSKDLARKIFKKRRSELSHRAYSSLSEAITKSFISHFPINNNTSFHTFLSSHEKREPDTYQIIKYAQLKGASIFVPFMQNHSMKIAQLKPNTTLEQGEYNISQPEKATHITPKKIDMIVVPLLTYDIEGNRVGYGKGYYDRFLSRYPESTKIGLSLFPPINKIVDIKSKDIKIDYCISPNKIHSFQ